MKTLHYSIIAILIFIILITLIIEFPIYRGPNALIVPSKPYQSDITENTIDEQKARSLAESYVDELKTISYGCQFQSVSGIYGTDSNGTSKLNAVQVGYTCTSRYAGAFVIIEDPQLTKVLNVTTFPSSRFGS
ncbi:MAG: hypothetical protein ACYC6W_10255 [Nitrosotalea sp.]